MNVTLAGDWHGSIHDALNAVDEAVRNESSLILHLGDFGIWSGDERYLKRLNQKLVDSDITLHFLDGNHENFPRLYKYPLLENGLRYIRSNIFHMPRGYRFTIGETSLMAFGGAYSVDNAFRTLNYNWWTEEMPTDEEVESAIAQGPVDVLLMHDVPASLPNPIVDNPIHQVNFMRSVGASVAGTAASVRTTLDGLLTLEPRAVFHGHYHNLSDTVAELSYGNVRVVCLDEGSAGILKNVMHINSDDAWYTRYNELGKEV